MRLVFESRRPSGRILDLLQNTGKQILRTLRMRLTIVSLVELELTVDGIREDERRQARLVAALAVVEAPMIDGMRQSEGTGFARWIS
jgi:hypothetical protein